MSNLEHVISWSVYRYSLHYGTHLSVVSCACHGSVRAHDAKCLNCLYDLCSFYAGSMNKMRKIKCRNLVVLVIAPAIALKTTTGFAPCANIVGRCCCLDGRLSIPMSHGLFSLCFDWYLSGYLWWGISLCPGCRSSSSPSLPTASFMCNCTKLSAKTLMVRGS